MRNFEKTGAKKQTKFKRIDLNEKMALIKKQEHLFC